MSEEDKKKIKIEVSRSAELEALREELEDERKKHGEELAKVKDDLSEKQAILEQSALEAFEEDTKDIIGLCEKSGLSSAKIEEIKEIIQTPKDLETVKRMYKTIFAGADKNNVGKATLTGGGDKKVEDMKKLIDDCYDTIEHPASHTDEELKEAHRRLNVIWQKAWDSPSMKRMRSKGEVPIAKTGVGFSSCPTCGHVNSFTGGYGKKPKVITCESCGTKYRV